MGIFGRKITDQPQIPPPPTGITKWSDDFHGDTFIDLFPEDRSRWSNAQETYGGEIALMKVPVQCLGCKAPPGAKACILKDELAFKAGMDFWCSFPFMLTGSNPAPNVPIMDLENSQLQGNPGRRLFFKQDPGQPLHLILEGKHAGATFRQKTPVEFPRDKWVTLKVHYRLGPGGMADLYQEGKIVCSGFGNLMPDVDPNAVYDRLSVGITKNDSPSAQVAYVGTVKVGTKAEDVA